MTQTSISTSPRFSAEAFDYSLGRNVEEPLRNLRIHRLSTEDEIASVDSLVWLLLARRTLVEGVWEVDGHVRRARTSFMSGRTSPWAHIDTAAGTITADLCHGRINYGERTVALPDIFFTGSPWEVEKWCIEALDADRAARLAAWQAAAEAVLEGSDEVGFSRLRTVESDLRRKAYWATDTEPVLVELREDVDAYLAHVDAEARLEAAIDELAAAKEHFEDTRAALSRSAR